ncbi:hypothetical protein PLICRDRAFT_700940 [Plicaturopsis crispa FD-325 SS-3]|nr:hypothetical protein PLICRDRAFT_700940 [Plicaturopsis crispa FD-325 SS-3]
MCPKIIFDKFLAAHRELNHLLESELGLDELRKATWKQELDRMKNLTSPTSLIAFCGETGAGKSLLINAIVGLDVVPTSGMQACTSAVIEVSHLDAEGILAKIHLMTRDEWRTELETAISDIRDVDGFAQEKAIALKKIEAVYPMLVASDIEQMDVDMIMESDPAVSQLLGTSIEVLSKDPTTHLSQMQRYVEGGEGISGAALWPMVTRVQVQCRSPVLSTGLVLVDLPGSGDANPARDKIAEERRADCDRIIAVASIQRAASSKAITDIFGKTFKRQLQNGNFTPDTFAVIATKTDQCDETEISRNLKLGECPEYRWLQEQVDTVYKGISELEKHDAYIASQNEGLIIRAAEVADGILRLEKDSKKRKQTSDPMDPSFESRKIVKLESEPTFSIGHQDHEYLAAEASGEVITALEAARATLRNIQEEMRNTAMDGWKNAHQLGKLRKDFEVAKKQVKAYCSRRRSQAVIALLGGALQQEVAEGQGTLINTSSQLSFQTDAVDQVAADSSNSTSDTSDVASEEPTIPVFACSAREHNIISANRMSSCFAELPDCGIIAVREWFLNIMDGIARRSACELSDGFTLLLNHVEVYLDSTGRATEQDKNALRITYQATWKRSRVFVPLSLSPRPLRSWPRNVSPSEKGVFVSLIRSFMPIIATYKDALRKGFSENLDDACAEGVGEAIDAAPNTAQSFSGKLHWKTFRAVLSHGGCFRYHNLNQALIEPVLDGVSRSWNEVFEVDQFGAFEVKITAAVDEFLAKFLESVGPSLQERSQKQASLSRTQAKTVLRRVAGQVRLTIARARKETSRLLLPHIQRGLADLYETALEDYGRGSTFRQRDLVNSGIEERSIVLFNDAADVFNGRLNDMVDKIIETIKDNLGDLAQKVELSCSALWEGKQDVKERARLLEKVKRVTKKAEDMVTVTSGWSGIVV